MSPYRVFLIHISKLLEARGDIVVDRVQHLAEGIGFIPVAHFPEADRDVPFAIAGIQVPVLVQDFQHSVGIAAEASVILDVVPFTAEPAVFLDGPLQGRRAAAYL